MRSKHFISTSFLLILLLSFTVFTLPVAAVGVALDLKTASPYGILGATTTVTGSTHVLGSLGSGGSTGTADVTGTTDVANTAYTNAFLDFGAAIVSADSQLAEFTPGTSDLGGQTLTPGVYKFTDAVTIGSNMILSGNGVYIFQIDGALTTAANTAISLSGGAQACNIFWVPNVATIGANSTFEGTLLSKSAVTIGADSVINGRVFAQTAVTANAANTRINVPTSCTSLPTPTPVPTPEPEPTPTPAPAPVQPTGPDTIDASCTSPAVNVKMNSEGSMIIHALLPNDAKGTGTWVFNIGGKTYKVKGSEDITYTAVNVPVGTYKVDVQFIPDDNGEIVDLASCTVSIPTVTGGQLPETSTPWYNLLLVGAILSMIGVAFSIRRKIHG